MSVVYKITEPTLLERFKQTNLVMVKGAPEELLRKCTHHLPNVETLYSIEPFDVILGQKIECQHKE